MNWLAHVYLSEPGAECRLGNLLADLVKGKARQAMSAAFLRGVACHQAVDAFTDFHPLVHRSRARLAPRWGRVGGILVDVFYDHFLARDWPRYSPVPLAEFTAGVYADLRSIQADLPAEARAGLERLIAEDRLGSYRTVAGIEDALRRVSARLAARTGRDFALGRAVVELTANDAGLAGDFAAFFPELCAHVERWRAAKPSGPEA
jgi:acyl carrier protein phosphodiesterase